VNWRSRWPLLRRLLTVAFLLLVAGLLLRYARAVDWSEVGASIAAYPRPRLALAAAAALLAYLVYCHLDVLARAYTGHLLGYWRVLGIALVCYAFNLNLGAWVGGIGLRLRLYTRWGLSAPTAMEIVAHSMVTNWLGYLWVGGAVLAWAPPPLPEAWTRRRERAYSEAYLRAAANAYLAGETGAAQQHLERAIDLQPALLTDDARPLADRFSAWTELPKTRDPVTFLETIYRHLPPRLDSLRRRRNEEIGRVTLRRIFDSYQVGDWTQTRTALRQLVRYRPAWFARRGVASILIRSYLSLAG